MTDSKNTTSGEGCTFVNSEFVMPGWGCCRCRVYNGLQRSHCKSCRHERCSVEVPDTIARCSECGFGVERGDKRCDVRCPVPQCLGVIRVEPNTGRSTNRADGNKLAKGSTVEDWPGSGE